MRHQRLRRELWTNCDLQARYQGRYLKIAECVARAVVATPTILKPVRKDHKAGGKGPSPPLWRLIQNE